MKIFLEENNYNLYADHFILIKASFAFLAPASRDKLFLAPKGILRSERQNKSTLLLFVRDEK